MKVAEVVRFSQQLLGIKGEETDHCFVHARFLQDFKKCYVFSRSIEAYKFMLH